MMSVPKFMATTSEIGDCFCGEDVEVLDLQLPIAFNELRHCEIIQGSKKVTQTWRMKERMKTVSVALVLCLNVGVDPPDVVKTSPCARLECWIDPLIVADPLAQSPQKSLEAIGANLQKQYERWQPRARYKQTLDPTVDEVKKLCTSLRRNAKDERVLFHYNGHGVPKPTVNGEIWVFNKSYTQYIPLSIYDLQTWMGSPSIYVYDCSHAGIIVDHFKQFSVQRDQESETVNGKAHAPNMTSSSRHCIQLAACGATELLPMNSELPADLFTSCLTTPIKVALRWYVLQSTSRLVPGLTQDMVDKMPGQLSDRRTVLGELNWIFTAITDTIAWNTLPRDLFQSLFRQDLLVASLFRNFLLAERIMRSYNCTPISSPKLPPTFHHPMWQAWDLTLDLCLQQLPMLLEDENAEFQHSHFFTEQLTGFDVWLKYGSETRAPPEQLPIVLQVLLSQVHRLRALELLGRFLDLGSWAVSLALSVGIFPYVLKLLQSNARELRPLLVFIWAKILSVDSSCQADLVKDNGHKYFLAVLADPYMPAKQKTCAAFVMAVIVNEYRQGQEAALQGNIISLCLEQLTDSNNFLRQWLALALAKIWTNFDSARWCGVRDSAHEKLYTLLTDPEPEVRAAAVYALGTFISNVSEKSSQANGIDLGVAMKLVPVAQDGSPLVRKEIVATFCSLMTHFETQFAAAASQVMEDDKPKTSATTLVTGETHETLFPSTGTNSIKRSYSKGSLKSLVLQSSSNVSSSTIQNNFVSVPHNLSQIEHTSPSLTRIPRTMSTSALCSMPFNNVYMSVWRALLQLTMDPNPEVCEMAKTLVHSVQQKQMASKLRFVTHSSPLSAPSSPSNITLQHASLEAPQLASLLEKSAENRFESPSKKLSVANPSSPSPYAAHLSKSRKSCDKGSAVVDDDREDEHDVKCHTPTVNTMFFEWSCKHFVEPIMQLSDEDDPEGTAYLERQFRYERNKRVRTESEEEQAKAGFTRLDNEIFVNRNQSVPTVIKFHPYKSELAVADKEGVSFWDWEQGPKLGYLPNGNPKNTQITSLEFINAHDNTLLMCASADGCVRLWRNYICDNEPEKVELVTAFQAISEMLPLALGSGLVTNWEQDTGLLLASGDVRFIRIWDSQKEMKIQDIPTGADSCVTCLVSDTSGRSLLVAGCGDGTVRLFDRRLSTAECRVMTLREHTKRVVKVHLQGGAEGKIITASHSGDLRFWDPRFTESVKCLNLQNNFTSVDIHPRADVLACGSSNQFIGVYNQSGDALSTIKYHEGFIGQRIGAVTSMAFHPYRVKLAAGSTDSNISVYSTSLRRN